jgi:PAS domain S-box-containing protein
MKLTHPRPDARAISGFERFASLAAVAIILSSILILIGWMFDIPLFKSFLAGAETTKPLSAVGFLCSGLALFFLQLGKSKENSWQHFIGLACASLVFIIGCSALLEYSLRVNFGIDQWLFRDAVLAEPGSFPGRPVFIVSFCLAIMGLALIAIHYQIIWSDFLALTILFLNLVVLTGYIYGSADLLRLGLYRTVPLPSVLLLIILTLGYLAARPRSLLLAPIASPLPGGVFARRLLLAAILVPLALGWIWLFGQYLGLYNTRLGVALLVTSNIMVFIDFIYWNARELNKADLQREAAHASLIQSEERFRSLVEATPAGLMMVEPGGRIALTNTLAENLFGYGRGQLLGKPVDALLPEQFWARHPTFRRVLNIETRPRPIGTEHDAFGLRQDGLKFPVEIGFSPIETSEGRFTLISIVDITERKQAEEKIHLLNATLEKRVVERTQQLDYERARWQGIVEGIADEVWSCDMQGKMSLLNLGTVTALGLKAFKNKSIEEIYQEVEILYPDGQFRPPEQSPLFRSLRGETLRGEEIMRHRQSGVMRHRHYSSAPMRNSSGAITGAVSIVRDITEQKQAEEGLHRFELLSANSKDIVLFIHQGSGRILEANAAAVNAYGYSRNELLALTIQRLRARNTRVLSEDEIGLNGTNGVLFESVHLRKDGSTFPVEISAQGAIIGGVRTLINIVRDITERKQAEAKQIYLASFPEQNPSPIAEADFEGQVRYANPIALCACPDLLQQGPAHPWLADWSNVILPFRKNQAEVITRDIATGNRVYQQTLHYLAQERLVRIYGADITERKRAEEQLERSNQKLNEILTSIQDDFYVLDRDWNFVYASRLYTAKVGKEPKDFVGNNIWKMFPNNLGTALEENFRAAMEEREVRRFEIGGRYSAAWYRMTAFPSAEGITVIGTDITERKLIEVALQENQATLQSFFDSAPFLMGIAELDGDQTIAISSNRAMAQFYATRPETLPGKTGIELGNPPDFELLLVENYRRSQYDGLPCHFDYEYPHINGSRWLSVTVAFIGIGSSGNPRFSLVVEDITERKRAEQALRESEERFASAFRFSPVGINIFRFADGCSVDANEAFLSITEYSREELIGHSSVELDLFVDRQQGAEWMMWELNEHGSIRNLDVQIRRKSGKISNVLFSLVKIDLAGETMGLALVVDVTRRKRAEDALLASEERYRAVFENALDAILVADPAEGGKILSANPAACRMFGYSKEEFLELERKSILVTSDPNFAAFMEQPAQGGQAALELTYQRKCGEQFSGELSSVFYQGRDGECRSVAIIRDITERKQDQEQLSAALLEKEVLLKEIHHRVKNNLQVISSLLRLQSSAVADAQVRELFSESQRRVRAMALIHEQLYQSSNLAQINLKNYISDLVSYVRRSYSNILSNIEIRVNIENMIIEMDQAMPLGLLVSELVSNSMKYAFPAHEQAGEIWIIARHESPNSLSLAVGDNGIGLPESLDIEHSATMGLKLVHSFVTQLQGQYLVQRKPGTVFTITIPERKV